MTVSVVLDLHYHDGFTDRRGSGRTLGAAVSNALAGADDEYRSITVRSISRDGATLSVSDATDALRKVDMGDAAAVAAAVTLFRNAHSAKEEAEAILRSHR